MRHHFIGILAACLVSVAPNAFAQTGSSIIGVGAITSSIQGADPQSFQTMLETQLLKAGKFTIIERSRLVEILREKGLGTVGITNGDKSISGLQGVDYLVYGTITQLGRQGQAANFGGFGFASNKVAMAVDLRVVDAHTGEIRYADTVQEQVSGGTAIAMRGFSTGGNTADPLGEVERLTAKSITALITTTIYPIKIITRQSDGTYIVNYGDSVLTAGDTLKVFKLGESFKDPDTGKILGSEETEIGLLKVSETTPSFSKAVLVSGAAAAGNTARRLSSSEVSKVSDAPKRGPLLP
jgi:curli biogenesis system outer membrane secretion channel CsgG